LRRIFNYNIHGILKINSDSPIFIPNYFLTSAKYDEPDVIIRSEMSVKIPKTGITQIMPDLFLCERSKVVISKVKILGIPVAWSLKNLWRKPIEVIVSKNYEILSKTLLKMPISTTFPIHAYIQHILHIGLLRKDHTFLVGGCVEASNKDFAIVLSSMGGMGKSTITLKILKEAKGKFLGDDMIIVNRLGTIYAYPKPIRWRRLIISPLSIESYLSPLKVLKSRAQIKEKSKVGAVCLLERGSRNELKSIEPEEAITKLLIIVRKALPYYMERTILAYSYMDNSLSLYKIMQKETEILQSFLAHANCYILKYKDRDIAWCVRSLIRIADECI